MPKQKPKSVAGDGGFQAVPGMPVIKSGIDENPLPKHYAKAGGSGIEAVAGQKETPLAERRDEHAKRKVEAAKRAKAKAKADAAAKVKREKAKAKAEKAKAKADAAAKAKAEKARIDAVERITASDCVAEMIELLSFTGKLTPAHCARYRLLYHAGSNYNGAPIRYCDVFPETQSKTSRIGSQKNWGFLMSNIQFPSVQTNLNPTVLVKVDPVELGMVVIDDPKTNEEGDQQ
ncbi:hypothetical protein [Vibrio sp. WXL210]|uniref:hypothetical protein n=1 Tax=Vibrio sp. WXL210 TaxID=3450709 RepID=UPI003EC54F41